MGSHAYFTLKLKLILTVIGLANAALFHGSAYSAVLVATAQPSVRGRVFRTVSLTLWIAVIVCACLNVEGPPKVLLS